MNWANGERQRPFPFPPLAEQGTVSSDSAFSYVQREADDGGTENLRSFSS